jgi:hypothetical protein
MDNVYLQEFIVRVEHELEEHRRKRFARNGANPTANNDNCSSSKLDDASSEAGYAGEQTVRGDEFERAQELEKQAEKLESDGHQHEAEQSRISSRALVETQLNEFDGFDRQDHPL